MAESLFFHLVCSQDSLGWTHHFLAPSLLSRIPDGEANKGSAVGGGSLAAEPAVAGAGAAPVTVLPRLPACHANVRCQPGGGTFHRNRGTESSYADICMANRCCGAVTGAKLAPDRKRGLNPPQDTAKELAGVCAC